MSPARTPIPVVFLHGMGGAARSWTPQLTSFAAAGYAPVALDLPGYGGRPAVRSMDFEGLAEDVENQIARRDLRGSVLVGHSLGGMVVQTMLRRRPDAYAAAVLSGTSPAFGNPDGDFQQKFVAARLAPLDAGNSMTDLAHGIVDAMMGPHPDPAGRALAIQDIATTPAETFRAAVHCLVGFDERRNLPLIRIPVLCLAGEYDRNAPAPMMERMAGRIPGARFTCLPGVGHLSNLEAPARFSDAVIGFLNSVLLSDKASVDESL